MQFCSEGVNPREAFVIRNGQVKLTLNGGAHLYPTRLVGSGNVIGLPAAVSGESYSLTARGDEELSARFHSTTKASQSTADPASMRFFNTLR